MNFEDLVCQYDDCKLIIENPVTLPCGNSLCKEHLEKFNEKFMCYFCNEEHQIPTNGFVTNIMITNIINNLINMNPLRKNIKESFEKLSESIDDYIKIDPNVYVFDYYGEIRNRVDLHREELKKEIDKRSDEIIQDLKEREEKCKENLSKIDKTNIDDVNLPLFKQKLRCSKLNKVELNVLLLFLADSKNGFLFFNKLFSLELF